MGALNKNSATGTRTRVARVRAEYPNQLDYGGGALQEMQFSNHWARACWRPGAQEVNECAMRQRETTNKADAVRWKGIATRHQAMTWMR